MSDEEIKKTVFEALFGTFLAVLTGAVGWLVSKVMKTSDRVLVLEGEVKELKEDQKTQITQECVRETIEGALDRRDEAAQERRAQWDETLALKIEKAVSQGVQECQARTKGELERMVPMIVREVVRETRRNTRPEGV